MGDIVVIFEGSGRRTEKAYATITEAVHDLVATDYTRVSGAPLYAPSVATRLYKATGSDRYARINTTSTPRTWPVVVEQVADHIAFEASQDRFWQAHYATDPASSAAPDTGGTG